MGGGETDSLPGVSKPARCRALVGSALLHLDLAAVMVSLTLEVRAVLKVMEVCIIR